MTRIDYIEAPDGTRLEWATEDEARQLVIDHAPAGSTAAAEARHPQSGLWAADARTEGFKLGTWRGRGMVDLEGEVTMVVFG